MVFILYLSDLINASCRDFFSRFDIFFSLRISAITVLFLFLLKLTINALQLFLGARTSIGFTERTTEYEYRFEHFNKDPCGNDG